MENKQFHKFHLEVIHHISVAIHFVIQEIMDQDHIVFLIILIILVVLIVRLEDIVVIAVVRQQVFGCEVLEFSNPIDCRGFLIIRGRINDLEGFRYYFNNPFSIIS